MQLNIRVIPRSSKNAIEWENEGLRVRLTAPPVDGAANTALIALLADRLHIPKRNIIIVRGATGRQKTVEIEQLSLAEIQQRLT